MIPLGEVKIGDFFTDDNTLLQCVMGKLCSKCFYDSRRQCKETPECRKHKRVDKNPVIFVPVESVKSIPQ